MASFQDGQERPPYRDINITEHHLQFNKSNVKLIKNSMKMQWLPFDTNMKQYILELLYQV